MHLVLDQNYLDENHPDEFFLKSNDVIIFSKFLQKNYIIFCF